MIYQLLLGSAYNGHWSAQDYSGWHNIVFVPVQIESYFVSLGAGNDNVFSFGGDGFVDLGAGHDRFQGGYGNSIVIVGMGAGNDRIRGGNGADEIAGGAGNDVLRGGAGDDTVYGNDGFDFMFGGAGNDLFYAGEGDTLSGGADKDIFSLRDFYEGALVTITDLRGHDRIELAPESIWAYDPDTRIITVNDIPLILLSGTSVVPTAVMFLID